MTISALAPWFGSNRMLAHEVGKAMAGCSWAGVVFAGGLAEIPHIPARTLLVNDKHRHVINLARVVRDDRLRGQLVRGLRRRLFHPDELAEAQAVCKSTEPGDAPDVALAEAYFVCCWVGRSSKAGIDDEFNGRPSVRWKADGGDSGVRYWSALRSLASWGVALRRCTFETMDAFDFLARCEDLPGHGVYADPPFPGVGRRYRHNAGKTAADERAWHTRLRDALGRFQTTRVVCRFYDDPLIRELYPEPRWAWNQLAGRKQTNDDAPEVLLVSNPAAAEGKNLFDYLGSSGE